MSARRLVRWMGSALLASLLVSVPAPVHAAGSDHTHVHWGDAGSVSYQVHLPPAHATGEPLPVVVAVHGCTMTGYGLNSMKAMTDLNRVADREGFIVVYPSQSLARGLRLNCWNGDDRAHQQRGRGEPALIAGLTEDVLTRYGADRSRVHVLGASSGAGIAVIMGVTYPDVYATVMSAAGAEYAVNEADIEDPDAVGPVDTAKRAWAQMGERARPVPVMVVQGSEDDVVLPWLGDRLVTHWAAIDDLAMNGVLDGEVDDVADSVLHVAQPGQHAWTQSSYVPRDGGDSLIEYVEVAGMGHSWPGPGASLLADNAGPDLAELWWDWAEDRRLP